MMGITAMRGPLLELAATAVMVPLLLTGCINTSHDSALSPSRLLLQQISDQSVIIKWRGEGGQACISDPDRALAATPTCRRGRPTESNHFEVKFTGLHPDTLYQYSIAGFWDYEYRFRTAPELGRLPQGRDIRIWILGDSGTASMKREGMEIHPTEAREVRDGFINYSRKQNQKITDLILLLGDNAYPNGRDEEWQAAFFDVYPKFLAQTSVWPTIGNHEMGSAEHVYGEYGAFFGPGASTSSDPHSYVSEKGATPVTLPYLHIFSLPKDGKLGGSPSGTEQYYAFNYGNLHIVSLDSQLSIRDDAQRQRMKQWLIEDLKANAQNWTIVMFHHPPYSRGSHNSDSVAAYRFDIDTPMVQIRQEFTAIFEAYGVDLVLSGHSHSYERSYQISDHRGDAHSFSAANNAALNDDGNPITGRNNTPYTQASPSGRRIGKVIYIVLGSSGHIGLDRGPFGMGKLDHPAHVPQTLDSSNRHGLARLGSLVLLVSENMMTGNFINEKGEVLDYFRLIKKSM